MDYAKYTLRVEGASGEEADRIARDLAGADLARPEGEFDCYAFDVDYENLADGAIFFGSAGETKDEEEIVAGLRGLSGGYPGALFVLDGRVPAEDEDDRFRIYFKGGRSQYAATSVTFEPFDEAKLG